MVGSGPLIAWLGHRIANGDVWLIAGYWPGQASDESGLAAHVGRTWRGLGSITVTFGLAMVLVEPGLVFWGSYLSVFVAALAYVQYRGRVYQ